MIEVTSRHFEKVRRKWSDGKLQKLETVLDSFIETIPEYMQRLRLEQLDEQCKARQELKAKERIAARDIEAKRNKQLIEALNQSISNWVKAKQIREYLEALVLLFKSGEACPSNPEAFEKWHTR